MTCSPYWVSGYVTNRPKFDRIVVIQAKKKLEKATRDRPIVSVPFSPVYITDSMIQIKCQREKDIEKRAGSAETETTILRDLEHSHRSTSIIFV